MSSTHAAMELELSVCRQHVHFAGKPIMLRTNFPGLLRHASGFLTTPDVTADAAEPAIATITLLVKDAATAQTYAPWFRGRGHFAIARFTEADTLWFNLRTREVFGLFSTTLANDRERWRKHILPALLGILTAVIDVVPIHAGCVVGSAGGVLLAAASGVGKSTLSVSLAKRGYSILSDDWTYLTASDSHMDAWGIPVPVKLLPDAGQFFPELSQYATEVSLNGEVAYEVDPVHAFGTKQLLRSPVACLVLLERSRERGCHIAFIPAEEARDQLIRDLEPLDGTLRTAYERQVSLINQLINVPCLKARFNDTPDAVATALDHAISSMS